jgi:hypothetical protein
MFRALLCPSSGASILPAFAASGYRVSLRWLCYQLCPFTMCRIPLLKIHFSPSNEILEIRTGTEWVIVKSVKTTGKNWLQFWVNILPVAFTTSVWPAPGCSGFGSMALARCECGWRFPAVCSGPNSPDGCGSYSSMVKVSGQERHTKISTLNDRKLETCRNSLRIMLEASCIIIPLSHNGCLGEFCTYQATKCHDIQFLHRCLIYLYVVLSD